MLVDQAERHLDWPMPGYTHLQRAQPVYLSHHLLAWFWKFRRDHQRFNFCMTGTDDLPLGAGALAGVNFDTARMFVAQELGFGGIAENSLDAVSNRDFVLDYLSAAATCATHLSGLGAEIVLWSSEEFGFCEVSDAFASGSSLMPQKKNPDAAELLRAKAPRVAAEPGRPPRRAARPAAHLQQGPPGGQGAALRRDRHARALAAHGARAMLDGIEFDRERLAAAAARRVPRRHRRRRPARQAGRAVPRGPRDRRRPRARRRSSAASTLSELSDDELRELAPELDPAAYRELLCEHGLARVEGLRGRHLARRACASSSRRRGTSSRSAAA